MTELAFIADSAFGKSPSKCKMFARTFNYDIQSRYNQKLLQYYRDFYHECSCGSNVGPTMIRTAMYMNRGTLRSGVLCCNPECNKTFTIQKD